MNELFKVTPLRPLSLLQRVFRQLPEENAIIEMNNLLATTPIMSINSEDFISIAAKYRVNVYKTFRRNLYEFYATFLNRCLTDKMLSNGEVVELKHLKTVLNLNDRDVDLIHDQVAGAIYRESVKEAIEDHRLDDAKRKFLEDLQSRLRLPEKTAQKLSADVRGKVINDYLNTVVANERLSPSDEKELEEMSKSLGVTLTVNKATRKTLDRYKMYWQIENGELTPEVVDINLQRTEQCYFVTNAIWHEQRTVTRRYNYAGPTARIKIMKGVYYRVGSVSGERITHEEWKVIDTGRVYLTSKRIIFVGSKKNSNIRLDKILSFTPYSDGIQINKETGRHSLLELTSNTEVFALLLSRLLREA